MAGYILAELKRHSPFTVIGASSGVLAALVFQGLRQPVLYKIFYTLHPIHVVLSALVTASMYKTHTKSGKKLFTLLLIGYFGSVGIATLSDSVIPFIAEMLLGMPEREIHIGFIEKWWLINPLAIMGVAIAYIFPQTKFPHAGHVLLSTWTSTFHILMSKGHLNFATYLVVFCFLFIAVWLPCCVSDIVFPLMFIKNKNSIN